MNRSDLIRATDLAHAAAHNITLGASYDRIRPDRADHFIGLAREALTAALAALDEAEKPAVPGPIHPVFTNIINASFGRPA